MLICPVDPYLSQPVTCQAAQQTLICPDIVLGHQRLRTRTPEQATSSYIPIPELANIMSHKMLSLNSSRSTGPTCHPFLIFVFSIAATSSPLGPGSFAAQLYTRLWQETEQGLGPGSSSS